MRTRIERTNASQLKITSDAKNLTSVKSLLWKVAEYMSSEDKYVGGHPKTDFIEITETNGMVFVTTNLDKYDCYRLLEDCFEQLDEEESSKICNEK